MSDITVKNLAIRRDDVAIMTKFLFLSGLAILIPSLVHAQWVTGPIINAILFLSVILVGGRNAVLIGLLPSIIALFFGLLPAPLAPMIPFIMIANAILIIVFDLLKNNFWLGVFVSSVLKFLFLKLSYGAIVELLLKKELAQTVAGVLSWSQLFTAIAGGAIAWGIVKLYRIKNKQSEF